MIGSVLIGAAGVIGLFVGVVSRRPTAYHVERTLDVAAPPDLVFGLLNDLHRFASVLILFGSPWEKGDPNMQKTFEGPAGVGQSLAWSGNREVGKGTMTIEESVPGQKVVIKLAFVQPMASTTLCTLAIAGTPAGSSVAWTMDGNHNFVGKAIGLFMNTDKMLGTDIEKSLAQLKTIAESKQPG
jgi:hypothetical protein